MNIPIAPITASNIQNGIILDNNTDNIIHINAKQLINQTAFLEVCQVDQSSDTQSYSNYDNDILRMNFSISTPISTPRSLTLPSRTTEVIEYQDAPSDYLCRNRRHRDPEVHPEGTMVAFFLFICVLIIIIFVKIN